MSLLNRTTDQLLITPMTVTVNQPALLSLIEHNRTTKNEQDSRLVVNRATNKAARNLSTRLFKAGKIQGRRFLLAD